MIKSSIFFTSILVTGVALAQTNGPGPTRLLATSGTLKSGITIRFATYAIPGGKQVSANGGGIMADGDVIHRYMNDPVSGGSFGYDFSIAGDPAHGYQAVFQPLTKAGESARQIVPKFPPPQPVKDGDTISLDLMASPDGTQRIVDYIQVSMSGTSSASGNGGIAGDWGGVGRQGRRFILHIAGPDNALQATSDSPDQNSFGVPVPSITFSGVTLQFSVPLVDLKYTGDLTANGTIIGTLTQNGSGIPLTLDRIANAPKPPVSASAQPAGILSNGHYHHNITGVEFDLPAGWNIGITRPRDGDPNMLTVLADPARRVIFASADMRKAEMPAANISGALSRAVPMLIGRRAGQTGQTAPHLAPNYAIRAGSEQRTLIGGEQALQAIADYQENGKPIVELLTWIYSEHTHVFFMTKMPAENLPAVQPLFEQMVRSASVP
jgi:hypothetical protein